MGRNSTDLYNVFVGASDEGLDKVNPNNRGIRNGSNTLSFCNLLRACGCESAKLYVTKSFTSKLNGLFSGHLNEVCCLVH